ncbi:MAG TPA: hypothetical protein VES02_01365, partial [Dermatophilaceae bacterium]|nr:hypothetical protein [Dermatophilaceae bacterium]
RGGAPRRSASGRRSRPNRRRRMAGGPWTVTSCSCTPLLLGTGQRLCDGLDEPRALRLTNCTQPSAGVLMLGHANS